MGTMAEPTTGRRYPVYPENLKYTTEHEWIRMTNGTARVGITAFAQDALGDIVFVTLPAVGDRVQAGQPFGEVESTKSVSDVYAPVSGEVIARNEVLDSTPELVNSDPYGEGWLVEVTVDDAGAAGSLLDAAAYAQHVQGP
jgi:glycine cleavage system H protein